MKKIAIGSDHGGFDYKEKIKKEEFLKDYEFIDCGTFSKDSCNYAEFALKVGEKISSKEVEFGILICNSGEGVSIAANKCKGVRSTILYNDEVAHLVKEHNDSNCICFGANFMTYDEVINRIKIYLNSSFLGERHQKRVQTIIDFENN